MQVINRHDYPLSTLRSYYQDQKVVVNPRYQRNPVWVRSQKQLLIDSILRDYDMPKFYWQKVKKGDHSVFEVIDGQQRMLAIIQYANNQWPLDKAAEKVGNHVIAGKKFRDLPDPLQEKINDYNISVVEFGEAGEDEISEMFLRLQNGSSLKGAEELHAYSGRMADYFKEFVRTNPLWRERTQIKSNRFDDYLNAMQLFAIEINAGPTDIKKENIEKLLHQYHSVELPLQTKKAFESRIRAIFNAFTQTEHKLLKHQLISVFLLMQKLDSSYVYEKGEKFAQWFIDFEKQRKELENDEERDETNPVVSSYIEYGKLILGGDNRSKLESRLRFLFERYLLSHPDTVAKDKKRSFSYEERELLLMRQNYCCAECKKAISIDTSEADHIKEHTKGGVTRLGNGQALCMDCHRKKTAALMRKKRGK